MKLKLCIPCAEQLKLGYSVYRITAENRKDTCENCADFWRDGCDR